MFRLTVMYLNSVTPQGISNDWQKNKTIKSWERLCMEMVNSQRHIVSQAISPINCHLHSYLTFTHLNSSMSVNQIHAGLEALGLQWMTLTVCDPNHHCNPIPNIYKQLIPEHCNTFASYCICAISKKWENKTYIP